MAIWIWANIDSGNGLLPDGTQDIVHLSSNVFCVIYTRTLSQEVLLNIIRNMCSEITLLKFLPHLPGANELIHHLQQVTPTSSWW